MPSPPGVDPAAPAAVAPWAHSSRRSARSQAFEAVRSSRCCSRPLRPPRPCRRCCPHQRISGAKGISSSIDGAGGAHARCVLRFFRTHNGPGTPLISPQTAHPGSRSPPSTQRTSASVESAVLPWEVLLVSCRLRCLIKSDGKHSGRRSSPIKSNHHSALQYRRIHKRNDSSYIPPAMATVLTIWCTSRQCEVSTGIRSMPRRWKASPVRPIP